MNNYKWQSFVGKHAGEKMIVVGLSPKSVYNFIGCNVTTIGVNDVQRYYPTDYTVCVDPLELFTPERRKHIAASKSRAVFSQVDIAHPRLVSIKLNELHGTTLRSPDSIDISYTSTFVACNLAYWMGAKKIGICGQDHDDPNHSLTTKISAILKHLTDLEFMLRERGVELVSLSPHSRINEVIRYEDATNF